MSSADIVVCKTKTDKRGILSKKVKCIKECICTIFLCAIGIILAPSFAFCDATRFIPRIYYYSGELEIDARNEHRAEKTPSQTFKTRDTTLIESLNLSVLSYVYHPRFITLNLSLSGGLRHNWYQTDNFSSSRTSSARKYNFRVRILPEHPYSLELFTMRYSPFVSGRRIKGTQTDIFSKGALFFYKKNRLFFNTWYVTNTIDMGQSQSDSKTYGINGTYFLGPSSTTAGYSKTESKTKGSLRGITESYNLNNQLGSAPVSFISSISLTKWSQELQEFQDLDNQTLTWVETLNVSLPGNLTWSARYRYNEYKQKGKEAETENKVGLTMSHKLYQSLSTSYTKEFEFIKTGSQGKIETITDSLSMSYIKKTPIGTLRTGFDYQTSLSERTDSPEINVTEIHDFYVVEARGGILQLRNRPIVDETDITIRIFNTYLIRDEHFIVLDKATAEILIIYLPDEIYDIIYSGDSEPVAKYYVSYILPGDVKLRRTTFSYNVRLNLFKNRVSPYYIYRKTTEEVLSGSLPYEQIENAPSHTIGVDIMSRDLPVAISGYAQRVYSPVSPSLSYSATLKYHKSLDMTTHFSSSATYTKTSFYKGTGTSSYSYSNYTLTARLQRYIPRKKLRMGITGSFSRTEGSRITSNLYSLTGNLSWKIQKLEIDLSAGLRHADSHRRSVLASSVHLNVKRKLF